MIIIIIFLSAEYKKNLTFIRTIRLYLTNQTAVFFVVQDYFRLYSVTEYVAVY